MRALTKVSRLGKTAELGRSGSDADRPLSHQSQLQYWPKLLIICKNVRVT